MNIRENTQQTPQDIARAASEAARAELEANGRGVGEEDEGEDGDTMEMLSVVAIITKDEMMKVPVRVFEHELPILYFMYGQDNISLDEKKTRTYTVDAFSADSEFDRLTRKYDNDRGKEALRKAYGSDSYRLAEELGLESRRPRGARQAISTEASLAIDHSVQTAKQIQGQAARVNPTRTVRAVTQGGDTPSAPPSNAPRTTGTAGKASKATAKKAAKKSASK